MGQGSHNVFSAPFALIAALLLLLSAIAGVARADESMVTAQLLADHAPLVAGQDATLAVQMDVAPGYHAQGAKPYDKYLKATRAKFLPQDGIVADAPQYPVSKDIPVSTDMSPGGKLAAYEGRVWILIPIHIDADAKPGSRTVQATLQTQVCNDQSCLAPRTDTLRLPVEIAAAGTPSTPQEKTAFDAARAQKFMETPPPTQPTSQSTSQPTTAPAGVVTTSPAETLPMEKELELIRNRPYQPANPNSNSVAFLFLLAILGGAILNIMPCVLPVIPLKILSLVQQAHGNRTTAVIHALVFSAGVITLFVVLAAALGSYQLFSGHSVIYGQQNSNPIFMLTLSLVVLALALSMLGVWTINTPQKVYEIQQPRTGYAASFMTGVLATVLATPCSAPLLGPVLFWALVHPLPVTMLAFALVGVGMSIPYIILAAFPAGLNRLPKTGRWSELLKQGLGIVMIGVALYLLTRIPQPQVWPWALAAAVLVSAVCWAWGQIPTPAMETIRVWEIRGGVVLLGLLAGGGLYMLASRDPTIYATPLIANSQWQPFSVAALDQALDQGHPVLIDWTADWCINCRAVEAAVLDNPSVQTAFARHQAVLLRADLSGDDPHPREAELLHKLGGGSIPVLAIFSPQNKYQPVVLQDIYSRQRVLDELDSASRVASVP